MSKDKDNTPDENQDENHDANSEGNQDKKGKKDKDKDKDKKKDDKDKDDKKDKKGGGRSLPKKDFSLNGFKNNKGLNDNVKDKDLEWIPLSPAFQAVTGLKGIPKGFITLSRGFSNTGKSTSIIECMVSCQRLGILPVLIDTEGNFNWEHARVMGLEFEEVPNEYGEIVGYEGFFIYADSTYLVENVGKKRDKKREVPTIEDVAIFMNDLLDEQKNDNLPYELCFLWDSIGTVDCDKSVESSSGNNMWNAGALEAAFKSLINFRIPSSRKEGKPYTNTILAVQKIWLDSMQGAGVVKHKGGEAFFYAARLILHFGGIQSHGTKRLNAISGGRDYVYGTQTKFDVVKNQVNGVSYKGDIVSTAHGFIEASKEAIDRYKKDNKDYLIKMLDVGTDADIKFDVEDVSDPE